MNSIWFVDIFYITPEQLNRLIREMREITTLKIIYTLETCIFSKLFKNIFIISIINNINHNDFATKL